MILELVTFQSPAGWDRARVLEDAKAVIPRWAGNRELARKHFLLGIGEAEGTGAGVYLWPSVEAAKRAHDAAWREAVRQRTGAETSELNVGTIVLRNGCLRLDRPGDDDPLAFFGAESALKVDEAGQLVVHAREGGQAGRIGHRLDRGLVAGEEVPALGHVGALLRVGEPVEVAVLGLAAALRSLLGIEAALGGLGQAIGATAHQLVILTGPNMGGKSTYLRQTALLCLMAQAGSFVPARSAKLPVVDRLFARVGASDNIARGQSTFMVEMQETANILHTATSRSLVVLDEIGRGTATYDGVSIAWAVTEHLHERTGAKTVFATHYHELTQLADLLPALVNFNVAVKEAADDIVFLRRLEPGGADRSYGIQVGRLAGLPEGVVARAREILAELEGTHTGHGEGLGRRGARRPAATAPPDQLSFFGAPHHPVVDRLRNLEVERLTPLEALNLLAELRKDVDA